MSNTNDDQAPCDLDETQYFTENASYDLDVWGCYQRDLRKQRQPRLSSEKEREIVNSLRTARREILTGLCEIPHTLESLAGWYASPQKVLMQEILESASMTSASTSPDTNDEISENKEQIKARAIYICQLHQRLGEKQTTNGDQFGIMDSDYLELKNALVEAIMSVRPKDTLVKKLIDDICGYNLDNSYLDQMERIKRAQNVLRKGKAILIKSLLSTAVAIAIHYSYSPAQFAELTQIANMGLLDAAEKFNAGRGSSFATYADYRMRGSILDSFRVGKSRNIGRFVRAVQVLEQRLLRSPRWSEIAAYLEVSVNQLPLSEDQPYASQEITDVAMGEEANPLEILSEEQQKKEIHHALSKLSEREQDIIRFYFGIDGEEPIVLWKIGERLGLSESGVYLVLNKAISKIRPQLAANADEGFISRKFDVSVIPESCEMVKESAQISPYRDLSKREISFAECPLARQFKLG